ncbi:unnamed protein product [Durusdinium trenchii]|uniref:Uncharacterized protein n=1 Tax=Durusdinium trenchii TaxID=1381693 RepID=A0ABP0KVL3_9DINO
MVQPESNPLEALQSWVAWANSGSQVLNLGLQDGLVVPGLGGTLLASRLPADAEAVDWEAALKRQNAANDELCSENSQLQLEVQRLAAEESREAWEVRAVRVCILSLFSTFACCITVVVSDRS